MGNKNKEKAPMGMFILLAILLLIGGTIALIEIGIGIAAFIESGGWAWFIVIGGLALVVFLLSRANRMH